MERLNRNMFVGAALMGLVGLGLSGCERPADIASRNISKAADNFEVYRRVVFYNGITDKYILTIEGYCSLGNYDKARELTVTCKVGPSKYIKHFLGLSDNVTFFAQQMEAVNVSQYHHRVMFRPQTILPDIDMDINTKELRQDRY